MPPQPPNYLRDWELKAQEILDELRDLRQDIAGEKCMNRLPTIATGTEADKANIYSLQHTLNLIQGELDTICSTMSLPNARQPGEVSHHPRKGDAPNHADKA